MKIQFLILFLMVLGCETKTKRSTSENSEIRNAVKKKIETVNRKFFIGDIDNDKVNDTAFVNFKRDIETNEIECGKNCCDINVEFKRNISKLSFVNSLGIVVVKTEDVNNDNANEIVVFSRTNEGWWNNVSVWTFKGETWKEIAETDAFISDDKDFENRVNRERGKYYLIGQDKWEEEENGDFKKIKVRL